MATAQERATTAHEPVTTPGERRGMRSALLSFLLPGVGQLTSGRVASGLAFLVPIVGVVAIGAVAASDVVPIGMLIDPRVVTALLVMSVLLFAWRAAAVLHAYGIHASWRVLRPATVVPWVLVALVALTQALPTAYVARVAGTLDRISDQGGNDDDRLLGPAPSTMPSFDGEGAVDATSSPSPTIRPTPPGASVEPGAPPTQRPTVAPTPSPTAAPTPPPTPAPVPTPTPDTVATLDERVTVLLLGTDDLANRSHRLTDTMLVVTLGAEDRRPVMISIPRDTYGVPLPDGRVYNARLNSLASYARARPNEFPLGGVGTLRETIEILLGLEIDYVASVDMLGLVDIVDAIGGVTVYVTSEIDDPFYPPPGGGPRGFHLDTGWQAMDGATALAYVRSRKGEGGNDFVRAGRQQRLLAAIRDRIRELGLVRTLPTLLEIVDENVRTDIPRDRLGHFAEAAVDANWDGLERIVLQPPTYMTAGFTDSGAYVLWPDIPAIRAAVDRLVPD